MIVGIETSAGSCLMQATETSPCPRCLEARLREAGFVVSLPPGEVDVSSLPAAVVRLLGRDQPAVAPVVRVQGDQVTRHQLLRFPGCPRCGGDEPSSHERGLSPEILRDPLTGITSCVETRDPARDGSLLWCAVTGRVHVPLDDGPEFARGHGPDVPSALDVQLGEAVERYAAFHPVTRRLVHAPASELAGRTPPIDLFGGFDSEQRALTGYRELDDRAPMAWVEGESVASGDQRFVPAASVYLCRSWNRGELRFAPLVSTGLACHRSTAEARERAMLEVLERFQLARAWHLRTRGSRLDPSVLPRAIQPLLDRLTSATLRLTLRGLAVPPDVPVVLAALTADAFPWITLGSSARLEASEAAAAATVEAALLWQRLAGNEHERPLGERPAALAGPAEHVFYLATELRARALARWMTSPGSVNTPARDAVPSAAVERQVTTLAPHAVTVTLTSPDCAACGFAVVRLVAPGVPLLSFGSVGTPRRHLARAGWPAAEEIHPFG